MNYYTDDITWCSNKKCTRMTCERNPKNIRPSVIQKEYSFADLEGTIYCSKTKKGEIT